MPLFDPGAVLFIGIPFVALTFIEACIFGFGCRFGFGPGIKISFAVTGLILLSGLLAVWLGLGLMPFIPVAAVIHVCFVLIFRDRLEKALPQGQEPPYSRALVGGLALLSFAMKAMACWAYVGILIAGAIAT
jgi:hypothetical protein